MSDKAQVYLELNDNYSSALLKIREIQSKFTNDLVGMQKKLDELNRKRYEVHLKVDEANKEVKELTKNVNGLDEATQKMRLEEATLKAVGARQELKAFDKEIVSTTKDLQGLAGVMSKSGNMNVGGMAGSSAGGMDEQLNAMGIAKVIATSELAKQFLGGIASYGSAAISSMYGAATGATIESISNGALSGITSGAALGTMIAPGVGTAVGAIGGALVGGISGAIEDAAKKKQEDDDRYRNFVEGIYDDVKNIRQEMLSSGIDVAVQREADLLSFKTLLRDEPGRNAVYGLTAPGATSRGDAAAIGSAMMMQDYGMIRPETSEEDYAQKFLDRVRAFSRSTPFGYDQLTALSKTFLNYGYSSDEILPALTKIGDAGAALHKSADDINAIATYIGRMKMTDKVTLEYINPLMERNIDAIEYIRKSLEPSMEGVTTADVYDMISKGQLSGEAVAQTLLEYMGNEYEGAMEDYQHSYEGLLSTLDDWKSEMNGAMGSGYTEARKASMEETIEFYEKNADELTEMYRKIGEYEAAQVNAQENAYMTAMNDALTAYRSDGTLTQDQISTLEQKAQAAAEIEYKNSAAYQTALDGQMEVLKFIQGDAAVNDGWDRLGRAMANQFTVGFRGGMELADIFGFESGGTNVGKMKPVNVPNADPSRPDLAPEPTPTPGFAYGIPYVPEDDYPVRLHRGERVLTGAQVREMDGHAARGVTVTGNVFNVRKESDIDAIALALYTKLREAEQVYVD